jgi:hypothetical protein
MQSAYGLPLGALLHSAGGAQVAVMWHMMRAPMFVFVAQ